MNRSVTFPYRLKEYEEVVGTLHQIKESEGVECIALIEKIPVLLPPDFAEKLHGREGHRISILRLDGLRFHDRFEERGPPVAKRSRERALSVAPPAPHPDIDSIEEEGLHDNG